MLSMKDEASFGGGGSSVNGLVGGVDRNLVIDLTGFPTATAVLDPWVVPLVDRPFSILKSAFVEKAIGRIRVPQTSQAAVTGTLTIMRDTISVAQIGWVIPASGQLNAPTVSGSVRPQVGSTLLAQLNKGYEVRAAKYDSTGTTPAGTTIRVALDADATKTSVSRAELSRSPGSGANNVTGSMNSIPLTAVVYDTVSGKETAPVSINMAINTGTFTGVNDSRSWNEQTASGNLPQGTVINMCRAVEFNGQYYLVPGSNASHTIQVAGGVNINSYGYTHEYSNGDTYITLFTQAFYKLSTHSTWTALPTSNQGNIIANTFPAGGISINSGGVVVNNTSSATRRYVVGSSPIPPTQRGLKLFYNGKLIYNQASGWPQASNISISNQSAGVWTITVSGQIVETAQATTGAPRGDEYFQVNKPIVIDYSVAPDSNAIGYRLYVRTADWNGSSYVYGAWRLAYEGSSNTIQNWQGATISNSNPPNTNSTSNYPASRNLQLSFPDGVERIDVQRGDSIVAASGIPQTSWSTNKGRIIIPIEFAVE